MFIIHFMTDQQVNDLARQFKGRDWVITAAGTVQSQVNLTTRIRIHASDGANSARLNWSKHGQG